MILTHPYDHPERWTACVILTHPYDPTHPERRTTARVRMCVSHTCFSHTHPTRHSRPDPRNKTTPPSFDDKDPSTDILKSQFCVYRQKPLHLHLKHNMKHAHREEVRHFSAFFCTCSVHEHFFSAFFRTCSVLRLLWQLNLHWASGTRIEVPVHRAGISCCRWRSLLRLHARQRSRRGNKGRVEAKSRAANWARPPLYRANSGLSG